MRYEVKIVPKRTPNADGEWVEVEATLEQLKWADMERVVGPLIPKDHQIVAIRGVKHDDVG